MSAAALSGENIFTVDVEEWFHVLEAGPSRRDWERLESRVEANADVLLEILDGADVKGTFFIVGWIAERYPALVERIARAGHEIGSHSFWHEVMRAHDRNSLSADVDTSRKLLQDLSGQPVCGFRAPGASITRETAWALDVIAEQGFTYDSSLCPGRSSHGGFPSPWLAPHRVQCNTGWLYEIPASTAGFGAKRLPYGGGGYLRLFPNFLTRLLIAHDNRAGRPANIYVHPREIDPKQPRMRLPIKRYFKYYVGLSTTRRKVEALLRSFRFGPAGAWIDRHRADLRERVLDVRAMSCAHPPVPPAGGPPPGLGTPLGRPDNLNSAHPKS